MRIKEICMGMMLCLAWGSTAQVARELDFQAHGETNTQDNADELSHAYQLLQQELRLPQGQQPRIYEGKTLGAIQFPVGGLGGGCIQYDGRAVPRYWQIFNNMTHDFVENSFLAVRVRIGDRVEVRALQTAPVGPFAAMQSLNAKGEFPFLDYNFVDDHLPVKIQLRVYNPFVPLNIQDSSIPAVFYQVSIENDTDQTVDVTILSSQLNAVGLTKAGKIKGEKSFAYGLQKSHERRLMKGNESSYFGGNKNRVIRNDRVVGVILESETPAGDEHFGQMALLHLPKGRRDSKQIQATASWSTLQELYADFHQDGEVAHQPQTEVSTSGNTFSAAVTSSAKIRPHQKQIFHLAMAWYFPNGKNGGYNGDKWDAWGNGRWEGVGNYYANCWENMDDLVSFIAKQHTRLYSDSRLFQQTFYDSTLPYWLRERLSAQLAILKSRTLFYDKSGYLGLWEGAGSVDGSCAGNCNHVWHYAQAHARLFPSLGRAARQQAFRAIKDNGQIPYRQPASSHAFDGQCGDILATYREYLLSDNDQWLRQYYPQVKQAIGYLVKSWDQDEDGWLEGSMHTTYDCGMSGNASFLTSLYVATLRAGVEMAANCDDIQQQRAWEILADKTAQVQGDRLWNGSYYIQIPDTARRASDYENGCHSDQLLGQWWADQLGLGDIFPTHRMEDAFRSILGHNFKATLKYHQQKPRSFALVDEPGLIVTTWPNNDRPKNAPGYSDEIWSTYEYTIAASLLKQRQPEDALTLLWAGAKRYDGRLRTGFKDAWGNFGYTGNPFGDDECGQFYSRALSNWSVLLAAQGFHYDGPKQILAFSPTWKPENHKSFFSTAQGWGSFTQQQQGVRQLNIVALQYGKLHLSNLCIDDLGLTSKPDDVEVWLNDRLLKNLDIVCQNGQVIVDLPQLELRAGDELRIIQ